MARDRTEANLRYYNKTRRKIHAGKFLPECHQSGPVGDNVTCKTCLMILKTRAIGSKINEWEMKRIEALGREREREKSRRWRQANPDKARAACKRWRERNKDIQRINNRQWTAKNRDHRRAYNAAYNARRNARS